MTCGHFGYSQTLCEMGVGELNEMSGKCNVGKPYIQGNSMPLSLHTQTTPTSHNSDYTPLKRENNDSRN